jgi:hypothetical protein
VTDHSGTRTGGRVADARGVRLAVLSAGAEDSGVPDRAGIDLGIAVLSRWRILDHDTAVMPARHRGWDPVTLNVRVDHPAGPLPLVAA